MSGCRAESQAIRASSRCLMELTFHVATSMADTIAAAPAARDERPSGTGRRHGGARLRATRDASPDGGRHGLAVQMCDVRPRAKRLDWRGMRGAWQGYGKPGD